MLPMVFPYFGQGAHQDLPLRARQHPPRLRPRLSDLAGAALWGHGGLASREAVDVARLFGGAVMEVMDVIDVMVPQSKIIQVWRYRHGYQL